MVWLDGRIEQSRLGRGHRLSGWFRGGVGWAVAGVWGVGSQLNGEKREVLIYLKLNGLEDSLTELMRTCFEWFDKRKSVRRTCRLPVNLGRSMLTTGGCIS
ncbi:hypothetical protein L6452_20581 [Arctium lappa]|uniref:Uncharacterized protein n=1 Tax=Arctium lappa TaxID=4217 RepID=A0ACB9BCM5_ARCLA|nr:hypothetical protein L6452_20581 [Arctium lappa]